MSQYLAIQEKGVSAWEFEPELEIANCFVEGRTEIEFFDSECTVMTNLPVPKQNEVYYWEAKIYDKPEATLVAIGMASKPYPLFRLPGMPSATTTSSAFQRARVLMNFIGFHRHSGAYFSNGFKRFNQAFNQSPYAPPFVQGDVIGCGYRPRTGCIFFTRNGKKLDDICHGVKNPNFFPTVGANGPATVHVNFGQAGFVFIEANVKKWGLAPMTGSLAPPPPYGSEAGSILLEAGRKDDYTGSSQRSRGHSQSIQTYFRPQHQPGLEPLQGHGRTRSGNFRVLSPTSPGPARSPTDISLAQLVPNDDGGEPSSAAAAADPEGAITVHSAIGLGVQDPNQPPPEYTSPASSDSGSRRNSSDSEHAPLIRVSRSRGTSSTTPTTRGRNNTAGQEDPPIPSYSDAVREGAGRDRSDSARSAR